MKNRIIVIENNDVYFLGLECDNGSVINLNELSKGVLSTLYSVKDDQKFDVLVDDITDF